MIVDVSNDVLAIDDTPALLKPNQLSQLYFWGFKKVQNTNSYKLSSKIGIVLPKILNYFDKEGITYSLSQSCLDFLSEIQQIEDRLENTRQSGRKFKEGEFDSDKFVEFVSFIKSNIARLLKDHQIKAAFHLYLVQNGANFSVPGSGKTAVILSVYEKLRLENNANLLFVVGPVSCFGPWRTEFKLTLGRKPDWKILSGGEINQRKREYFVPASQRAELYLTTYQTLMNDQDDVITFLTQQGVKVFLVIDEAHYIKQIGGEWARAVLRISEYTKYRCILTGTPMPRSYTDVFNMFDSLWPNNSPLDSEEKMRIKIHEDNNDTKSAKELLERSIGPLFYRVRKSDLGLIPPIFHPPFVLPMKRYEKIIYDAIESKIANYTKQDYLRNIDLVRKLRRGRIIRLRQCVSYIQLLLTAIEQYKETLIEDEPELTKIVINYDSLEVPAKLEYLTGLIGDLQKRKQKVVIWANFIGTLKKITKHLSDLGYACKLIYGETPIEQTSIDEEETREKIRNEFVDPRSGLDILVANPAACAESISLHKTCYYAIYYDLSYNCAQYLQSLDRIHRVGGSEINKANYYFLQYENTIDQDIKDNLERKASKMYKVIEADYGIYSFDMFEEEDELEAYGRLFDRK